MRDSAMIILGGFIMGMTWDSLTAAKGASGAIATWMAYTKLDVPVIVDEAQALLFMTLRCREMRTELSFTMAAGQSYIALPPRFLDPIGRIYQPSFNLTIRHKDGNFVQRNRNYSETSGTLGTNPFTTIAGSNLVSVNLPGHGFNQDSVFNTSGAAAFNGVTINGTFPISAIVDPDNFLIDISVLGTTPSSPGAGGGSSVAYICDNLVQGVANWFGIWNERIYFDTAFLQTTVCKLQYFQSLPLLSSSNPSNFLTDRYPQLMRQACMAAAADFMQDDAEYQKKVTRLGPMIQKVSEENDMMMRGMELDTETP